MTLQDLRQITEDALEGKKLKNSYPMLSVSETRIGKSLYIQNDSGKIRVSNHSVANYDRVVNEEHFNLRSLDIKGLKRRIVEIFSDDYVRLTFKNGINNHTFNKFVLKTSRQNWKSVKVFFYAEEIRAIKLEEIENFDIVELYDLTKKGDKRFCKVMEKKYRFGAKNIKTNEVLATMHYVHGPLDLEGEVEVEPINQ